METEEGGRRETWRERGEEGERGKKRKGRKEEGRTRQGTGKRKLQPLDNEEKTLFLAFKMLS